VLGGVEASRGSSCYVIWRDSECYGVRKSEIEV